MAIKLDELDALLGYDPDSHSVMGLPAVGRRPPVVSNIPQQSTAAPTAAPTSIPKVGQAPDVPSQPTATGMPQLGDQTIDYNQGIPTLQKPHQSVLSKIGHGLETAGEAAGTAVIPGVMAAIPGTRLNKEQQQNRGEKMAGEESETGLRKAQTGEAEAETWKDLHPTATTSFESWEKSNPNAPISDWVKLENAGKPETDFQAWERENPQGNVSDWLKLENQNKPPTPEADKQWQAQAEQQLSQGALGDTDRTKLAGLQRTAKLTGIGPEVVSQVGQPPVPADYPKGENDPGYKKADAAWGKAAEGIKNQEAGASGAARAQAYGEFRPVQIIDPNTGNETWTYAKTAIGEGAAPVAGGAKAMAQGAQLNDIRNASQKVREAISANGDTPFKADQVAKLTLAMTEEDPTVMRNEVANLANSGLTRQQQDLVTWLYQLQERALSLRNIAGMGQGSETTRQAILRALPSITSGNSGMALKQLDAFDNMVKNLSGGVPGVKRTGAQPQGGGVSTPSFKEWKASQGNAAAQ